MKHIVLFRNDLRFDQQPALAAAIDAKQPQDELLFLFHLNPEQFAVGTARHDYFFKTVEWFKQECRKIAPLHFIVGTVEEAFQELISEIGNDISFYFNRQMSGFGLKRDEQLIALLEKNTIPYQQFLDGHIHSVYDVMKPDGSPYKVFTPYFRQWVTLEKPGYHRLKIQFITAEKAQLTCFKKGEKVFNELVTELKPSYWDDTIGLEAARKQMVTFLKNGLENYDTARDIPSIEGTSRLSPYLKVGVLSIVEVFHAAQSTEARGQATYIKELAWRDFYQMIACYHPDEKNNEIMPKYRAIEWEKNPTGFKAWSVGETGFPIVDAAMKQLNCTGWMHNRLRMIVASFLVKDLGIDWREGERYFSERLIDYDAASNIGGWQWAASTGVDAVPYFRIFNPTVQSERFDAQGDFIREWIPELVDVASKHIHEPHKYNISYIIPIVDHAKARLAAIERFKKLDEIK